MKKFIFTAVTTLIFIAGNAQVYIGGWHLGQLNDRGRNCMGKRYRDIHRKH